MKFIYSIVLQQASNPFHMPPPPLGHTHHSRPPMPFSGPPPPVPGSNVPPPPLSWNVRLGLRKQNNNSCSST